MPPLQFRLRYSFDASPSRVWPIIANTERMNRALGLPEVEASCVGGTPDVTRRHVRAREMGLLLEYEEEPFEWIENQRHHVVRTFRNGPFRSIKGGVTLEESASGCEALIWADFEPASALTPAVFPILSRKLRRDWDRFVTNIREYLGGSAQVVYGTGVDRADPVAAGRVRQALRSAPAAVASEPLAARLFDLLSESGDVDLERIRPFRLARQWGAAPYEVLGLCLRAARMEVLDLSWEIICPNCRGRELRARRMDQIRGTAHCESCQIVYDANFDRYVEATFRPNPRYRKIDIRTHCVAGPGNTPHVVCQLVLAPGESRSIATSLSHGDYRLRGLTGRLATVIAVRDQSGPSEGAARVNARLGTDAIELSGQQPLAAGQVTLDLDNQSDRTVQVVLERLAWDSDCATAAAVSVFQEFRDLFGSEALSPDVQLSIESLPILFTDLKGSTAMYERLGDATAYAVVRDHFHFLEREVAARGGGIIKTIGDAIMAAFPDTPSALDCALAIQRGVTGFNQTQASREHPASIDIKLGLHRGPCLAVRANDRLDYFGSTVNMAARLHEHSLGGDVVISQAVHDDPAAADLLTACELTPFSTLLRGIKEEQRLWRVQP